MNRINLPTLVLAPLIWALFLNTALVSMSTAAPDCVYKSSDSDGDGWGWENHRSCVVQDSSKEEPPRDISEAPDDTDDNSDLYKGRHPYCSGPEADNDGDGWGYENYRSCFVRQDSEDTPTDDETADDSTEPEEDDTDSKDTPADEDPAVIEEDEDEPADEEQPDEDDAAGDVTDDEEIDEEDKDKKTTGLIFRQQFTNSTSGLYQSDQLNSGWNNPLWHLGFDEGRVSITTDDKAHGNVMEVTYPAGAYGTGGGSAFLSDVQFSMGLPKSYDELYISYDLKFGEDFEFVRGGKLPGLCGANSDQALTSGCNTGGGVPSGYDGWSVRTMWRKDGAMENYVYHAGQKNYYGDDELWNVKAVPDKWHRVQHRIVLNTVGSKDGILEAWFDGKKVLSIDNFEYRKIESVGINLFYFSTFFGGNDPSWAPSTDQTIRFDNFAISTKPITD